MMHFLANKSLISEATPTDPVNALLRFGYSLLPNKVASVVQLVWLRSLCGLPALAFDLMEEFRLIIVASMVLTVLNKRILALNDFVVELGAYRLNDARKCIKSCYSNSQKS